MAIFKPRSRILYFRVSEEEFERFNNLCKIRGARSLSDLVRSAVNHFADGGADSSLAADVNDKLEQIDERLSTLNRRLDKLSTTSSGQARNTITPAEAETDVAV